MKFTGLNELREQYLSFYEDKGHLRLPSFSLIPQGDSSLLLINSGMAPMKKYFTGEIEPPRRRVTTCQKCIRTPDIDNVGKTARHGTFFEMLGNFSFGDYFKQEAITWAWEFCTKVVHMDPAKIYVTIYEEDDEAYRIWTQEAGLAPSHVVRKGKADNFWEHGSGPCGPCSELHYDRGEQYGCGSPDCGAGCECDRYVEFWNLVFTQFENDGKGNYTRLDHPNIDTGMGLERLACITQNVDNIFEIDTVRAIMDHVSRVSGVSYGESAEKDVSLRVITDHIRSATMMIGDGVFVSNEGRGYVLRRLLRRAARHGKLLGVDRPFLYELCRTVIQLNQNAYPNLAEKRDMIEKIIRMEEESFLKTIDAGMQMLAQMIDAGEVTGEKAFMLYDTYGFPLDLTKEILAEKGLAVDEESFMRRMERQKTLARTARKDAGKDAWKSGGSVADELEQTVFTGYTQLETQSDMLGLLCGGKAVETLRQGEKAQVVLRETPFYAESGGQCGDKGVIRTQGALFRVEDTVKTATGVFLHAGVLEQGTLSVADAVTAAVDAETRASTARNHTAAHLLQAALRQVLGTHVEQAGQLVTAQEVRFDFTHFAPVTREELEQVESLVNQVVLSAIEVSSVEMPIAEAKKLGATALFGEKYGDIVRVVTAGDFSRELCGGTHVDNTAKLGLFKIVSESSVASGVRRIQGVTGGGVLAYLRENLSLLGACAQGMKVTNFHDLPARAAQLAAETKEERRRADALAAELSAYKAKDVMGNVIEIGPVRLVTAVLDGVQPNELRAMCDEAKAKDGAMVAVFAGVNREKGSVSFAAGCGADAVKAGAHAGNLIREVAKRAGGSGGGRPDGAMAGGKDSSKAEEAIQMVAQLLADMVQS